MRILHVSTFLQGGAGRVIASLAVAQQRAGHHVTVVADAGADTGYGSYPEYLAQLAEAGVGWHTVCSTFTRDLSLNVQAARQWRGLVGHQPVDVVHTHAAIPTLVARIALGRRQHVRVIQTMHGWGICKTPDQEAMDITLLGLADAVVTPSAAARETLRTLGLADVPIHVIPYGLEREPGNRTVDVDDAALFARLRADGASIVLCIGTLCERKNQALLVKALVTLSGVEAVFIGDGDTAPLRTLAAELGVAERVHVLGYRADASRYVPEADTLVLPSRNEGLPVAVLEALRAGVPVVGSAIPEIAEAVDDGRSGVLFTPDDCHALASAVRRGVDPSTRDAMRSHARAAFEQRYDLGRMIAAYESLYLRSSTMSAGESAA